MRMVKPNGDYDTVGLWEFDLAVQDRVEGFSKWQGALKLFPCRDQLVYKHPFGGMRLCDQSTSKAITITFFAPLGGAEMARKENVYQPQVLDKQMNRLSQSNGSLEWVEQTAVALCPILSFRAPVEKMVHLDKPMTKCMS